MVNLTIVYLICCQFVETISKLQLVEAGEDTLRTDSKRSEVTVRVGASSNIEIKTTSCTPDTVIRSVFNGLSIGSTPVAIEIELR